MGVLSFIRSRTQFFLIVILAFGIAVRVGTYGVNRSMVLDEAATILQIYEQTPQRLLTHAAADQAAPIGFLLAFKGIMTVFGMNEYVLRFVPFVASILSLFLFVAIARKLFARNSILFGLAMFAACRPLVDYSSVVKQHSGDVAISEAIMLLLISVFWKKSFSFRSAVIVAIVGSVVIWFSQPVLFILGGVGMVVFFHTLIVRRDRRRALILIGVGSVWLVTFAATYVLYLRHTYSNDSLVTAMNGLYVLPEVSWRGLGSFWQTMIWVPTYTLGIWPVWLGIVAVLLGCIVLFLKDRWTFMLLITPILLTMVASHFRLYPFFERYLLFLVPNIFLIISGAVWSIPRRAFSLGIASFLLLPMVWGTLTNFGTPWWSEEMRPLLTYYQKNAQPGDTLYLYYGSILAYRYYKLILPLPEVPVVEGTDRTLNLKRYVNDLQKLDGKKRVWILFSHIKVGPEVNEELFFISYLNTIGKRIDAVSAPNADLFLYDL